MARTEHDREDLLREATALVERVELQIAGCDDPIVAGFRGNGAFSCYFFGGDPVYQFNTAAELRRAFVAGLLYKAEGGHLIVLHRERDASQTVLRRRPCDAAEEQVLLAAAREHLRLLQVALQEQRFKVIGEVPIGGDVVGHVRQWLSTLPADLRVADRPHSG